MGSHLKENTVQQTLCIPLWGRMIAAEKYPSLFPDNDAKRIIGELGVDLFYYFEKEQVRRLLIRISRIFHMCFMIHAEFCDGSRKPE